jgi:glycosyltransferase involved in cell wall biosynthesis
MTAMRIALVGLKCYDLIADAPQPRYFGGAERQQVLLARGLAARGHHIAMVTLDYGQPDMIEHRGVRVFAAYAADAGLPGVRFLHPRWSGLARALTRADPDVVFQMGADSETGQIAAWCGWSGRPFVFSLASDADVDPALPLLRTARQRALYRFGLKRAHPVVAQTNVQRDALRAAFHVDATVIRNCTPDPGFDPGQVAQRGTGGRPRLLWVGRFVQVKRLGVLLELAEARPEWDFHVVGSGDASQPDVQVLERRAQSLANVTLHRRIGDEALDEQYRRAHALICTSSMEGVPTTFLEAWARGVPVVSTVDPDGVIAEQALGAAATTNGLASAIDRVLQQDQRAAAQRIRAHFLATHAIEPFVLRHEQVFAASLACGARATPASRRLQPR